MKKNQLSTTKSTALILSKTKNLMSITNKILGGSNKGSVESKSSQELSAHKDITLIGNLMWEKESQEWMTWAEGIEYAENLRLGGYDDWRLPTVEELLEVVALCGGQAATWGGDNDLYEIAIKNEANEAYQISYTEKGFFASEYYWSSTVNAGFPIFALNILFISGCHDSRLKVTSNNVRCVRAR